MKTLKSILERIEPWAIFLSILGILFLSSGKGLFWLVLFGVSCVRVVRAWSDSWRWFSLETLADLRSALGWLVAIVVLYFGLGRIAPSLAYSKPSLDGLAKTQSFNVEGTPTGQLLIEPGDDEWRVRFSRRIGGQADFVGYMSERDVWSASGRKYRGGIRIRAERGTIGEVHLLLDPSDATPLKLLYPGSPDENGKLTKS